MSRRKIYQQETNNINFIPESQRSNIHSLQVIWQHTASR